MLSLESAIKHCEEVAEKNNKIADTFEYSLKTKSDCKECASEHRQLAKWLRELWALTEAEKEIRRLTLVWEEGQGIQKCIDILDKWHGEVKKNENEP